MPSQYITRLKFAAYSIAFFLAIPMIATATASAQAFPCSPNGQNATSCTFQVPIVNSSNTSIGNLVGAYPYNSVTSGTCSGISYTKSLYVFQAYELNGYSNGNDFQGGGVLQASAIDVYYYTYTSTPPKSCPAPGFQSLPINMTFGSSSNLIINGVKQANPQNYGAELTGSSAYIKSE